LLTMSDRGRENNGIANMHTTIRHQLDPSLHGTMQHRWCINKTNIKAEATWSQIRAQWTPGFEDVLDHGVNIGIYDASDPLEKYVTVLRLNCTTTNSHSISLCSLVFRWIAIPWLQAEIDKWVQMYNSSTRRANKNKLLPHGIPDIIHQKPERFQSKNFQVSH
jgi:hypothetical protein